MNGRAWTEDDKSNLCRLVAAGLNDTDIGERMNRLRTDICKKRSQMKLQPGQSRIFTAMMSRMHYRRMVRA